MNYPDLSHVYLLGLILKLYEKYNGESTINFKKEGMETHVILKNRKYYYDWDSGFVFSTINKNKVIAYLNEKNYLRLGGTS